MQLRRTNLLAHAQFPRRLLQAAVKITLFHILCLYFNFLRFSKTIMYVVWIIIASLICGNCVAIDGTLVNVNKYCRDRDRLITSEENDEYLLVGAENNTNIMLACRYW